MSQLTSYRTATNPSSPEVEPQERLAVKSALKATLDRELADEASTPGAGAAATPQHLAGPGHLRH